MTSLIERAKGRTYQRVLEACLWASWGDTVCFLCGSTAEITVLSRLIREHAPQGTKEVHPAFFKFPGNGGIELRQLRSNFAGQRYDRIQIDELTGESWRSIEAGLEKAKRTLRK